jgi:tRNA pseudouridine13 synthase
LRSTPEDFQVDELLGFAPSGSGPHVLLRVQKRAANTEWVARQLARVARVRAFDVGYAGLKDRHALATQWFSVPESTLSLNDWLGVQGEGYAVLEAHAHRRKLPRGALAGNRFVITLRELEWQPGTTPTELTARCSQLARVGVPNYFGPQRFGRDCSNLLRALRYACDPDADAASHRDRSQRSFALSAARALIFNAVCAERVATGQWCELQAGEVANLNGSGSVFAVDEVDAELAQRCLSGDVHPTGPLWGVGELTSRGAVAELERALAARCARLATWLEAAQIAAGRRALRLTVRDFSTQWLDGERRLQLRFTLAAGEFATTVLKELALLIDQGDSST